MVEYCKELFFKHFWMGDLMLILVSFKKTLLIFFIWPPFSKMEAIWKITVMLLEPKLLCRFWILHYLHKQGKQKHEEKRKSLTHPNSKMVCFIPCLGK